jgi:divalent metal cation (Fe/Co/Zn/Cd) transporter
VVAILVFALGAGVSLYEGVLHILEPEPTNNEAVAFTVLGIAFVLEGWSTWEALREFNVARGSKSVFRALQDTKDAPTLIVLLENAGALAGLAVAALGIALAHWTHNPLWDGIASVTIGLILAAIAVMLIIEAKGLLIGESADPALVEAIRACALAHDGVEAVHEVLTVHQAPDMVVSVISADFDDAISARAVEQVVRDIEAAVAAQFPVVTRVYVRPFGAVDSLPSS